MQTLRAPLGVTTHDRVLIQHAHPDDEILNASAIHGLVQAGIEVHFEAATDGEQSTKGNPDFVRRGKRREELQQSLGIIGIAAEQQHFFGLPDGRLHERQIRRRLTEETEKLAVKLGITVLITPGWFGVDGHTDHRTVHRSSVDAARRQAHRGNTIAIWALNHLHQGSEHVAVDERFKDRLIRQHQSQYFTAPGDYETLRPYHELRTQRETYDRIM